MRPIPFGQTITLSTYGDDYVLVVKYNAPAAEPAKSSPNFTTPVNLKVVDQGLVRVALKSDRGFISVASPDGKKVTIKSGKPGESETFQWVENVYGDLMLMSLISHRHIHLDKTTGAVTADHPGPKPDRKDGSCLTWKISI